MSPLGTVLNGPPTHAAPGDLYWRRPEIDLLGNRQSIVNLYSEIAYDAFQLGVAAAVPPAGCRSDDK
jgi:hypothetical protein